MKSENNCDQKGTRNHAKVMSKKKLEIKISASGANGRIDIVGAISEWNENNAVDFRAKCEELKKGGTTNALVYMMTVGGDCFQGNEISNILLDVFGSYDAKGGALVASAGTYIMARAKKRTQVGNGQFMIHKPMGGAFGNETEMANKLVLIQNMTSEYYNTYLSVLKKPEAEFKEKWDNGDFWMTAKEAKEWGFLTDVEEPVKVDDDTKAMLTAMGRLVEQPEIDDDNANQNLSDTMEAKATALLLGMDVNSTPEQINARIAENAKKAAEYDTLKAQIELKEKQDKAAKIKAELDKGEKDKKFPATARAQWQTQFEKDFDGTKALLDMIEPVVGAASREIKQSPDGKTSTYQGKTWEQWQDEDPEALAALEDENPDAFNALFADWQKRNLK